MKLFRRSIWCAVMLVLMACSSPKPFKTQASYRSVAEPDRGYDIHITGSYPPGADMADTWQARVVMSYRSIANELEIESENFTARVRHVQTGPGMEISIGQLVDQGLVSQFIRAIATTATQEQINREAQELLAIVEAAGMGPKVGLPETDALELVTFSHGYR